MTGVKTAAVGEHSSVVLFGTAGITVRTADDPQQAEDALKKLIREGYEVIFLTEKLACCMEDFLAPYRRSAFPLILPVPDRSGATDYSMKHITHNMEKAIGTNIFDKN
ncbi:MAG TPA: V-type ATP synthase subunit F [Bacillota bacterium]|nr:V-type ATP synthase subunit F [Bacillota bacterium]